MKKVEHELMRGDQIKKQDSRAISFVRTHPTYLAPSSRGIKINRNIKVVPTKAWTVAAEGVEVEYNPRTHRYRIVKAISVIDIGTVLNEKMARGQVMGAMSMGLSFAGRETFWFDSNGRILNPQLRKYRPLRYGEHPEYVVDFFFFLLCRLCRLRFSRRNI